MFCRPLGLPTPPHLSLAVNSNCLMLEEVPESEGYGRTTTPRLTLLHNTNTHTHTGSLNMGAYILTLLIHNHTRILLHTHTRSMNILVFCMC